MRLDAQANQVKVEDHADKRVANMQRRTDKEVDKLKSRIERHDLTRRNNKSELHQLKAVLKRRLLP